MELNAVNGSPEKKVKFKMSKVPKICFVSHASNMYGAPKALLLLLPYFTKDKYSTVVLAPGEGQFCDLARKTGTKVKIIERGPILNILEQVVYVVKLVSWLIQSRPDLLYINTVADVEPILAGALLNIKTIVHVRETDNWFIGGGLKRKIRVNLILKTPAKFVCVSKATADILLRNNIPAEKVKVVYDGIDHKDLTFSQKIRDDKRREMNIGENTILAGFIGQVVERKRVQDFVEAAYEVKKQSSAYKFVVVGGPLDTAYFKDVIQPMVKKFSLENDIVFTDFRTDAKSYFAAVDIFVNPTGKEPFAMVNLEAMAMERPIVATNVGGNAESIINGVTGFIVPERSPKDTASKIIEMGNDPELRLRMGLAARKRLEEHFTVPHYFKAVEAEITPVLLG